MVSSGPKGVRLGASDLYDNAGTLTTDNPLSASQVLEGATRVYSPNNPPPVSGSKAPSDNGLLAWTYDPALALNTSQLVNGTVYLRKVWLRAAATISKVYFGLSVGATTPTAGQNFVGVYNSAGTLVASVGVDAAVSGAGLMSANLTVPYAAAAGFYWTAIVVNAATPPTLIRGQSALLAAMNANLTAATLDVAVATTAQTSLPTITPTSNTATGAISLWSAIS